MSAFSFLGMVIGLLCLMAVYIRRQKLAITFQTIAHSLVHVLIFTLIFNVGEDIAKILLLFGMLLSGIFRAFYSNINVLFLNHCNIEEDKFELSIWGIFTSLGDVIALLLIDQLMKA